MDFLRYVLALDADDSVESGFESGDPQVSEAIFQLALTQQTTSNDRDAYLNTMQILTSHPEGASTTVVNDMRLRNGGEIPETPSVEGDKFLAALLILARDIWAAYLVVPPSSMLANTFFAAAPVGLIQHPIRAEMGLAFAEDPALSKLFPDIPQAASSTDVLGHMAMWFATAGSNGSKSPMGVLSGLLFDASVRMRFSSSERSYDAYSEALTSCVGDLRLLSQGQTVHVPAIVGFSGITFPGGAELSLTSGIMRSPRPIEKELLLASGDSVTAVFETTFPLRIIRITQNDPSGLSDAEAEKTRECVRIAYAEFEEKLDKVRLSLLLSSDGKDFLASLEHSRFIFDLTSVGGSAGAQMVGNTLNCRSLENRTINEVERMHDTICSNHPNSLNIAMQRVLQAASARGDDSDGLIDALIAWENMFGASTETTFRVTASLAKLIESGAEQRREKRKELAKIYASRSKIVHGAKEIPSHTVYEQRQEAILIACLALRMLYMHRTDLLELKSEERGIWLLLEDAPPLRAQGQ
ncbi:HEPN domain-containing protein [Streptomyces sp. 378]|uniref:HEPN domain-containing protein n=1 Tax=Streptomyces sp. 378 TaxID=3049412 RepID=UPI0024C3DE70|nr:HEPN domain-containing protein [Streptomyces sp. 378]MDK1347992.1 HEPN domain-containing protein [Streptomyces sp. 378]